jgi:hypothetical protein
MEQTAVEWLEEKWNKYDASIGKAQFRLFLKQAKEMEKKQMYSKGDYCAVCGSREFFNDEEE